MKYLVCFLTIFLTLLLASSDAIAKAQTNPTFSDTVVRIKEDDDGKLIVLSKTKQILYLMYNTPNFDSMINALNKSHSEKSSVIITTDSRLNVIKVD